MHQSISLKDLFNSSTSTRMLNFHLVSSDGGEYSEDYSCENMLIADSSVYCTSKKENVNIILKHESSFILTHVIVKAPEMGFTCPIGSGLIFVSNEMPDIKLSSKFDSFDEEKYEKYIKDRNLKDEDPCLFFDLKDKNYAIIKLPIPRFGRFIHIKLLKARKGDSNIDIQYMGFRGFVGKHAFEFGELI